MTPKSRFFWPTLLIIVCGVGLGVFYYISSLISYFSSDELRQEFESRVGRAIGGRTVIGSINCDLSGLVTITDIEMDTVPVHDGYPRLILKIPKLQFPWTWSDVLVSDRLPIKDLYLYSPSWTITSQGLGGYYDVYGLPAKGLPIPPDPTGKINPDGSYVAPHSTLGWLMKLHRVKVVDGEVVLTGSTGKVLTRISGINFFHDGPPFDGVSISSPQVSIPNSPLTVENLEFSGSADTSGGIVAQDIRAKTNLGLFSGAFHYTNGTTELTLRCDTVTYNSLASVLSLPPDLFEKSDDPSLIISSRWTDLDFAHPKGSGDITLAPSHLSSIPSMLTPLTLIHKTGGNIDPVSGRLNFSALLDMDNRTALATLTDIHCVMGLPVPPPPVATPTPTPTGRRRIRPPTPPVITGSSITSLEAVGAGTCDFSVPKFTSLFNVAVSDPTVAAILTTATQAKPKIGAVWTFQVLNKGDLKTFQLAPPPTPTPTPTPKPTPTPTPAPTRRRHHY